MLACLAILVQSEDETIPHHVVNDPFSPWGINNAWRLNEQANHVIELTDEHANHHHVNVIEQAQGYIFNFDGQTINASATLTGDHLVATINGHKSSLLFDVTPQQVTLFIKQDIHHFTRKTGDASDFEIDESDDKLTAPMNGTIVDVPVAAGQQVKSGDVLVIMEAMKMEYSITAPFDGTVQEVFFATGDMVKDGDQLVELKED